MRPLLGAAAAAACALMANGVSARAAYDIPAFGGITQTVGNACGSGYDPSCTFSYNFTGTLELVLPSAADGDYSSAGLSMTLLGVEGIEGMPHGPIGFTSLSDGQIDVLVTGGRIVSFTGWGMVDTGPSGNLGASASPAFDSLLYGTQTAQGPFTLSGGVDLSSARGPFSLPVPEPAGAALALAGLALLAIRREGSQRHSGGGQRAR